MVPLVNLMAIVLFLLQLGAGGPPEWQAEIRAQELYRAVRERVFAVEMDSGDTETVLRIVSDPADLQIRYFPGTNDVIRMELWALVGETLSFQKRLTELALADPSLTLEKALELMEVRRSSYEILESSTLGQLLKHTYDITIPLKPVDVISLHADRFELRFSSGPNDVNVSVRGPSTIGEPRDPFYEWATNVSTAVQQFIAAQRQPGTR